MDEAFCSLQSFPSCDYTLFGGGEKPVSLYNLVAREEERGKDLKKIAELERKCKRWRAAEILRPIASVIGLRFPIAAALVFSGIFLEGFGAPRSTGVPTVLASLCALLALVISIVVRDANCWKDYWISPNAQKSVRDASWRQLAAEKDIARILERQSVWEAIPETIRGDVRRLAACISDFDANVNLYNAEAKRAAFYVERGHLDRGEAVKGLAAMRETLDEQKKEIIGTLMAADQACVALVCRPEGERAVLTPDLEALRERLSRLGEGVKEELALESIMRKELGPASLK